MPNNNLPTAEQLRSKIAYNPETGALVWKIARNSNLIGTESRSLDKSGYVQVHVLKRTLKGHRLAWLLHFGEWPNHDIDHINGDRADNRIENLRQVLNAVNCQNKRSPLPSNKLGILGVSWQKGAYRAAVTINRKQHHLGRFATAEQAHAAYVAAKRLLHPGCTL